MKKVLFGAMAALTLVACSNDEVTDVTKSKEIKFNVTAGKAVTRAADGYCNDAKPENFDVWAKQGTINYFAATNFVQSGSEWVINDATLRYWPESGTLDFFAMKNYNGTVNWDATNTTAPLKVTDYTVEDEVGNQKDFIYAVSAGAANKEVATLNFRHALSQIEFQAKNDNKNIYVEITGVKVVNVANKGTLTLPIATTANNFINHANGVNSSYNANVKGTWATTSIADSKATYTMAATDGNVAKTAEVLGNNTAVGITTANATGKEYSNQTLYVMPQTVDAWDGTGKPGDATNAYFALTCKIWNVAAGDGSQDKTGAVVWDGTSKDIAVCIPASTVWEQGKRYVYTFNFTKGGNGGIDPDGDPVFTAIKLSVTVDDFAAGTDATVDMNK